jgi:tRNA uridine 5-carboxymethylaminomethyl modification enzyme
VQRELLRRYPAGKCGAAAAGYAIEYDYVDPRELLPSLETKRLAGSIWRTDQRHDRL